MIIVLLLKKIFYYNLKKADVIVTVSNFWKNHFLKRGYSNIYTIHNSFDLNDLDVSEKEVQEFKKKYNLFGKPIIYLGDCQKAKGVVEVYRALKDLDVFLITSGRRQVKIPTKNLEIKHKEYPKLIKASSVVIIMSKFKEGWSRSSHMAMLCKIPVIGSGTGGMKELLEGGKQIICLDFKFLRKKVEYLLNNSKERKIMGDNGYNFAKNFTKERFEKEWIELIKKLL